MQHLVLVGKAVADDVVHRGAHAEGIALVVEVGAHRVMRGQVFLHPAVDVGGGDAGLDVLAHVVEHAHVHLGGRLDALDVGRGLEQNPARHLLALHVELLQSGVDGLVALLVLLAASTPAGVVAAEFGHVVVHCVTPVVIRV